MNNKSNRKNKTNQIVKWPATYFTIDELNQQNSDFVNITLRVRLKNAINNKQVAELGVRRMDRGRPQLVFACSPVTAPVVEAARTGGIFLHEFYNHSGANASDGLN